MAKLTLDSRLKLGNELMFTFGNLWSLLNPTPIFNCKYKFTNIKYNLFYKKYFFKNKTGSYKK